MTSKSHDPLVEVQNLVAMLPQHVSYKIGTYVLVRYEGELWPGQITKVEQDRVRVKCFKKQLPKDQFVDGLINLMRSFTKLGMSNKRWRLP